MQRQLNCFKLALSGARWSGRPFHFSKLQYLALSPGVVAVGLFAFVSHENLLREWGDHLGPGETVSGTSGLYVLSPPDDGWVRVKPGTIEEETDLELYGSSTETWVVAYVNCGAGMGMDYLVEFRQNQIQAEVDDFSVSEERLIMPGKLLPVSYAHYSGKLPVTAEKQTWWVATIVTDDASIEVIAGVAHPVPWTQVCLTRRA